MLAAMPMHMRRDVRLDELHRVEDRQAGADRAARRVDVEVDVLVRVLALQEQHLRDDQVGGLVVDRADQEDQPLAQQPAVDVVGALAAARRLDDDGHHAQTLWFPARSLQSSLLRCVTDVGIDYVAARGAAKRRTAPFGAAAAAAAAAQFAISSSNGTDLVGHLGALEHVSRRRCSRPPPPRPRPCAAGRSGTSASPRPASRSSATAPRCAPAAARAWPAGCWLRTSSPTTRPRRTRRSAWAWNISPGSARSRRP